MLFFKQNLRQRVNKIEYLWQKKQQQSFGKVS